MNENVKLWLEKLYSDEIKEVTASIENERIWEKGYVGNDPNPHTINIEDLEEYIETLKELLEDIGIG